MKTANFYSEKRRHYLPINSPLQVFPIQVKGKQSFYNLYEWIYNERWNEDLIVHSLLFIHRAHHSACYVNAGVREKDQVYHELSEFHSQNNTLIFVQK